MQTENIEVLQSELESAYRSFDELLSAYDISCLVNDYISMEGSSHKTKKTVTPALEIMTQIVGAESINTIIPDFEEAYNLEPSIESIKEFGVRIWKALANALSSIYMRLRALFRAIFKRSEANRGKLDNLFSRFNKRLEAHDSVIKELDLRVGERLTPEQEDTIKESGKKVFVDSQGKLLSRRAIETDLSLIVPPGYRRNDAIAASLMFKGEYGDIPANVNDAISLAIRITASNNRSAYLTFINKLMAVKAPEDIRWLMDAGLKDIADEDKLLTSSLSLKNKGSFSQGKAILGDLYPTFITERSGILTMHTLFFSGVQGRLEPTVSGKPPKGLPRLSLADAKKLREGIDSIASLRIKMNEGLSVGNEVIERYSGSNGERLQAASAALQKLSSAADAKTINSLTMIIRGMAKSHRIAFSYITEMEKYIRNIENSLDALLVLVFSDV